MYSVFLLPTEPRRGGPAETRPCSDPGVPELLSAAELGVTFSDWFVGSVAAEGASEAAANSVETDADSEVAATDSVEATTDSVVAATDSVEATVEPSETAEDSVEDAAGPVETDGGFVVDPSEVGWPALIVAASGAGLVSAPADVLLMPSVGVMFPCSVGGLELATAPAGGPPSVAVSVDGSSLSVSSVDSASEMGSCHTKQLSQNHTNASAHSK